MSRENMNSIGSRELNYMIYRYLERSGFQHSAFILENEADIKQEIGTDITSAPPEALITLVHKGLQHLVMEVNKTEDMIDVNEDYISIEPFDLITKNVNELKQIVKEKKKLKAPVDIESVVKGAQRENKNDKGKNKDDKGKNKLKEPEISGEPEPMNLSGFSRPCGVRSPKDILVLRGHSEVVWTCAWNPASLLLASGCEDNTARIWNIAERSNPPMNRLANVLVLEHGNPKTKEERMITTLDWNADGSLLATGSHDGFARIWNSNGELKSVLRRHTSSVVSVKWNKKGDHLLTGSSDRSVIVWDVNAYKWIQQFEYHLGFVLHVDWRNNHTFASAATDPRIYVCKIGESQPLKMFFGHTNEVNCVKWDPSGTLLASCSDDNTVKVWSMKKNKPIHDFNLHTNVAYTVRWCPIGSESVNSNTRLLLASGSYDSTVKLWDVDSGTLLRSLNGHKDGVQCISFSPNGKFLATGSWDKMVHIWSVEDGKIMKTYCGYGNISHISWTNDGKKIAFSTHNKTVCVTDVRM